MMSADSPLSILSRTRSLARMMVMSLWVRSSSILLWSSITTEGRTVSGGTASTVQSIHSGRANIGLRPIAEQSSLVMRWKARCTNSGWMDTGGGASPPLGVGKMPSRVAALPAALATLAKVGVWQFGHASIFFRLSRASLNRAGPDSSGLPVTNGLEQLRHTRLHSFSTVSKNW